MCGIVGFSGEWFSSKLEPALSLIGHRGPDNTAMFRNHRSSVGLGHARLSILDTSPDGNQPMISDDGSTALAYNGEIYNFVALRQKLIDAGCKFQSGTDTEVVLKTYLKAREDGVPINKMLQTFNGMFSIALWDASIQSLYLARDAFGIKPLYYSETTEGLVFASEIKSFKGFEIDFETVDPAAVENYLTYLWCPGNATPLSNVKKLGPGELATVKGGKITCLKKWSRLPEYRQNKKVKGRRELSVKVSETLREAVHSQMVSDVPVGAFLSGGLDSSSVVAFARERDPSIQCFTIIVYLYFSKFIINYMSMITFK